MQNQAISKIGRRYDGLFRDNQNHPARKLLALRADSQIVLPPAATTSQWMGPIYDQGIEGKCTGEMGAEIYDSLYRQLYNWVSDKSVPPGHFSASSDFVYLNNLIAGGIRKDVGSTIHQTFISLNQHGVCLLSDAEDLAAAGQNGVLNPPSPAQYAAALKYPGGPYHFLPTPRDMKACIAGSPDIPDSGYSLGFGIAVYESFEAEILAETGFMPMPGPNEKLLGFHAQKVMDFNDDLPFPKDAVPSGKPGGYFIQNSWGSQFGISAPGRSDRGCYWMPYEFVDKVDPDIGPCVSDAWMMHFGKPWPATQKAPN